MAAHRHTKEDNIKVDPQEVGLAMDWIDLAQDTDRLRALVNAVRNLQVPQNARNLMAENRLAS